MNKPLFRTGGIVLAALFLFGTARADGRDSLLHWWKVKDLNGDGLLQPSEFYDVMTVGAAEPKTGSVVYQATSGVAASDRVTVETVSVGKPSLRTNVTDQVLHLHNPTNWVGGVLKCNYQAVQADKSCIGQAFTDGKKEGTVFIRFKWDGRRFKKANDGGSGYNYDVNLYGDAYNTYQGWGWVVGFRCYDSGTPNQMYPYFRWSDNGELGFHMDNSSYLVRAGFWYELAVTFRREQTGGEKETMTCAMMFRCEKTKDGDNGNRQYYYDLRTSERAPVTWNKYAIDGNRISLGYHSTVSGSATGLPGGTTFETAATSGDHSFVGSIHEVKEYAKYMSEYELVQVMTSGEPECMIGSKNGKSTEFTDTEAADVYEPATMDWSKMRQTLTSANPLAVRFDLAANGHELGRLVEMKFLKDAAFAGERVKLTLNGTTSGSKVIPSDGEVRVFLRTELLSALAQDPSTGRYPVTLTVSRDDALGTSVALDYLTVGGAWQLGNPTTGHSEFGGTVDYYNYFYNIAQRNPRQFSGSIGNQGSYAPARFYFGLTDWAAANLRFRLSLKSYGTYNVPLYLTVNGDTSSKRTFTGSMCSGADGAQIDFATGYLEPGNRLECSMDMVDSTKSMTWDAFDCLKLEPLTANTPGLGFGETFTYTGTAKAVSGTKSTDLTNSFWKSETVASAVPAAGNDYLINGGRYCGFTGASVGTFPGDSLTLGDSAGGGRLVIWGGGTATFPSLYLVNGGIWLESAYTAITLGGSFTMPTNQVSIGTRDQWNNNMTITASLHGAGNLYVYNDAWSTGSSTFFLRLVGDASDYTGTLMIGNPTRSYTHGPVPVYFGPQAPRKAVLRNTGAISACMEGTTAGSYNNGYGNVQLDTLELQEMSAVRIYVSETTNTVISVAETLTMPASGKVRLQLFALPAKNLNARRVALLRAPAGQGLSLEAFQIVYGSNAILAIMQACSLVVETEGEEDVLYLDMEKYTSAVKADSWGQSSWQPDWSDHWSGIEKGTPLDPEMTYVNWYYHHETPQQTATFDGKKYVLVSGNSRLCILWGTQTLDDFVLLPNGPMDFSEGGSVFCGVTSVLDPAASGEYANVMCAGGVSGEYRSEICGGGNIQFIGMASLSSPRNGSHTMTVSGINASFAGKMRVTNNENDYRTNMTVVVTNAIALGGPRASFAYDAFSIGRWSRLRVKRTTAFDEPTRGFYVFGNAYVDVVDATNTFTLGSQTTMAGQLVKEGAGTLALGGKLRFTSSQSETPLEGTNVLTVSEGWIRPASKDGANGLAITFKEGTGLKFTPLAETDADVGTYGLYNVACATPFDLTATGGKLNVQVEVPDGTTAPFKFCVCTVAEEAADALEGNIELPKLAELRGSVVRDAAVDGKVSFRAVYGRSGLIILFR